MNPFLSQNNIGSFQGARSNHVQVAPAQAGNNLDALLGLARPNDFSTPANDGLDRINFYPDRQDSFRPPGNQPSSIFDNLPSSSTYGTCDGPQDLNEDSARLPQNANLQHRQQYPSRPAEAFTVDF